MTSSLGSLECFALAWQTFRPEVLAGFLGLVVCRIVSFYWFWIAWICFVNLDSNEFPVFGFQIFMDFAKVDITPLCVCVPYTFYSFFVATLYAALCHIVLIRHLEDRKPAPRHHRRPQVHPLPVGILADPLDRFFFLGAMRIRLQIFVPLPAVTVKKPLFVLVDVFLLPVSGIV